jgi:microcystin-dependent protein
MAFRIYNNNTIGNVKQNIDINRYLCIRVGDYKYSSANTDVNNWLICDGRSLSRSQYDSLFNVIGTSFGAVNGNSFSLPDYRGRVPGAVGAGPGLTSRSLGVSVGAETHTLTIPEMPTHQHTGTTDSAGTHNHGITDPGHSHSYVNNVNDQNTDNAFATETAADQVDLNQTTGLSTTGITINNDGAHTHTFTTQNTGGGNAHNNMQPTLFGCNVFILSKLDSYDSLSQLPLKLMVEY